MQLADDTGVVTCMSVMLAPLFQHPADDGLPGIGTADGA